MIFWWFFYDFLGFVWFSRLKQNLQKFIEKSSKNYQKKSSSCLKKPRKLAKIGDFDGFSRKTMIFWWFPRFCMIFSFEAKPSKIIEKSIEQLSFFYHCFFHSVKNYHFCYRCFYHSVCPLRTPASIPRNFFVSKSSWQTCWRWLSQGLNSARLPCTWTLGTWCQDI